VLLDPDTGEPYVSARGRKWGSIDLVDGDVRAQINAALVSVGGAEYFRALAVSDVPSDRTCFVNLVAKTMPTEVKGSLGGNFVLELVNYATKAQAEVIEMASSPLLE
jgi:hypothetical protein